MTSGESFFGHRTSTSAVPPPPPPLLGVPSLDNLIQQEWEHAQRRPPLLHPPAQSSLTTGPDVSLTNQACEGSSQNEFSSSHHQATFQGLRPAASCEAPHVSAAQREELRELAQASRATQAGEVPAPSDVPTTACSPFLNSIRTPAAIPSPPPSPPPSRVDVPQESAITPKTHTCLSAAVASDVVPSLDVDCNSSKPLEGLPVEPRSSAPSSSNEIPADQKLYAVYSATDSCSEVKGGAPCRREGVREDTLVAALDRLTDAIRRSTEILQESLNDVRDRIDKIGSTVGMPASGFHPNVVGPGSMLMLRGGNSGGHLRTAAVPTAQPPQPTPPPPRMPATSCPSGSDTHGAHTPPVASFNPRVSCSDSSSFSASGATRRPQANPAVPQPPPQQSYLTNNPFERIEPIQPVAAASLMAAERSRQARQAEEAKRAAAAERQRLLEEQQRRLHLEQKARLFMSTMSAPTADSSGHEGHSQTAPGSGLFDPEDDGIPTAGIPQQHLPPRPRHPIRPTHPGGGRNPLFD